MNNSIDDRKVESLANLLKSKPEAERAETFEALGISDEEQLEVRRILAGIERLPVPGKLGVEDLSNDDNFKTLVPMVRRGKAILFVGSGISQGVGMPTSNQLIDALQSEARAFGNEVPQGTNLREAARIVEKLAGRSEMVGVLQREFEAEFRSNETPPYRRGAYRLLPDITQLGRLIVTTNWDDLLRRAFQDSGESVVEISENAQLSWISTAEHAVIKLHGSFDDPEKMIITDMDYAAVTSRIFRRTAGTSWGHVASLLAQYTFIFLGYSLEDPDFQLLRQIITSNQGTWRDASPHFMVAPLPQSERKAASRWGGVRVISTTATDFLLALFQELGEFTNRRDALKGVFDEDSKPFIEFYGPFGMGKSRLLDEIEACAEAEGWLPRQILRVDWGRQINGEQRQAKIKSTSEMLQVLERDLDLSSSLSRLEEIGPYLRSKKSLFLFMDGMEWVRESGGFLSLLSDNIAPVIQQMNDEGRRSKLVVAGRFPLSNLPYAFRRDLDSRRLRPLQLSAVREMARKFLLAKDPDSQERFSAELLTDIVEISGGHPGFVKYILRELTGGEDEEKEWYLPSRLAEAEKERYISHFSQIVDKQLRWQGVKDVYEEQLSVYRWVNREILTELEVPVEETIRVLIEEYILMPDSFTFDPVIQHIKMLQLRYKSPIAYKKAHETAQDVFLSGMKELRFPAQGEYIVEWLFHTAHLLLVKKPDDMVGRREQLLEQIKALPPYQVRREILRGNPGEELEAQVMKDDELLRVLEMYMGSGQMGELFDVLENKKVKYV